MVEAIEEIRWWFEAGGYEVSERVGLVGGEIDRFAVLRRGIRPPTLWWTAAERFPDDLGAALDALEEGRRVRGADQALVVVTGEEGPATHRPDLSGRAVNYVSLRYLALHLSDVLDEQRELAACASALPSIERLFRDEAGNEASGQQLIDRWIAAERREALILGGNEGGAIDELIHELVATRLERCLRDPQQCLPITMALLESDTRDPSKRLMRHRWVVGVEEAEGDPMGLQLRQSAREDLAGAIRWEIQTPTVEAVMAWLHAAAATRPTERLRAFVEPDDGFRDMFLRRDVRVAVHEAIQQETSSSLNAESWAVSVLSLGIQGVIRAGLHDEAEASHVWIKLEDGALRTFALGAADGVEPVLDDAVADLETLGVVNYADGVSSDGRATYLFTSRLVRDWFLARKIAREVRAGNLELLTRHVFPREYVGLFLAVLAPDVASLVGADRSEALRREIEAEVARKVQLTLGHQLNRAIGALGARVRTVRRTFRDEALDDRTRTAFTRIDEELDHLRRLTERSRLLDVSASPWELVTVPLEEAVSAVAEPLRQRHPDIAIDIAVSAALAVRAAPEGLREVVHCILENAFHSVGALPEGRPRSVHVSAGRDGETVRLRVRDNGTGVRPEDQERIFQPYVTTKTGGPGEPRGTGLGLSIARTFAERMGAQVSLEASNGETVFVMVFVAGR